MLRRHYSPYSEACISITYFPHQLESVAWLVKRKHALLALDMGLGKTAISILAAKELGVKRPLIVCPAVAVANWRVEFKRHWSAHPELAVVSYHAASRIKAHYDLCILDECHYLKSVTTQRTRCVLGKHSVIHAAQFVWGLSGTPAPNHAGELWPLCYVLGFTRLKYDEWIEKFCVSRTIKLPGKVVHQISGTNTANVPELRKILEPHMLRMKKEDVMKALPKIYYETVTVQPGAVDLETDISFGPYCFPKDRRAELFQKLEDEAKVLKVFLDGAKASTMQTRGMAALQMSLGTLRRYTGLQKVAAVVQMVKEELDCKSYDKVVLFAIHQGVVKLLRDGLAEYNPLTLYGGTPPEKRQSHIEKFQSDDKYKVFIGNIHAAGSAITLTRAHNIIFVEQDWVPGNNAQAAMRCHRIGQTKPVYVRFITLADSLDERVSMAIRRKTAELTKIFDIEDPSRASLSKHSSDINETS